MLARYALSLSSLFCSPLAQAKSLSDAQIKKLLIRESIDNYPGRCPCPYNAMKNGRSCGGRSALLGLAGIVVIGLPTLAVISSKNHHAENESE